MDNKNYQQKKKKKGSGFWGLAVLLIIWAINALDSEKIRRFFSRLQWSIRTGRLGVDGRAAVTALAVVIGLLALVIFVSVLAKKAREKRFDGIRRAPGARTAGSGSAVRGGSSAAHSHDQLQGYRGDESAAEHWKKQLDGFLEAGIIDRSEYRVLLERRRR